MDGSRYMEQIGKAITKAFSPIMGLQLSIARNAGCMKVFHFGELRPHPKGGTTGAFALHVQCPWRIISREAIVTGSDDYWQPAPTVNKEDWTAGGSDRACRRSAFSTYSSAMTLKPSPVKILLAFCTLKPWMGMFMGE